MTRTRALLAGLVALSLLVAACGDDDDTASDDTSTTVDDEGTDEGTDDEATDDASEDELDVCALFTDIEAINTLTGEAFSKTDQTEDDTCQLTNADDTALLQLSVTFLEEGQTASDFVADGSTACDEGTEVDIDFSYAEGGFACEVEGQPAVAAVAEGGAGLLIGHASDPAVTTDQLIPVLSQIMESLFSA